MTAVTAPATGYSRPDVRAALDRLDDHDCVDDMRDALLEALHAFDVALDGLDDEYAEFVVTTARATVLKALDAASAYFTGRGDSVAERRKTARRMERDRIKAAVENDRPLDE